MDNIITWDRREIHDIYNDNGIKRLTRYPAKSRLLHKEYHEFDGLSVTQIEHLLRHMASNDKQEDWMYNMDSKGTYNDCVINNYTEDQLKLKNIQNKYNITT